MCLYSITSSFDPPDPTLRIGHKVLSVNSDVESGLFRAWLYPRSGRLITTNMWLRATGHPLETDGSLLYRVVYPSGFHVFPLFEDAQKYACHHEPVVRVVYKDVQTSGPQFTGLNETGTDNVFGTCHVARQIFYPRDQTLSDEEMLRLAEEALK